VLYTFTIYNSNWKFHQLAAGQLLSGQAVRYGKGRRYGPSITYKITPAGSLFSSHRGGPPYWASPLVFGLTEWRRTLGFPMGGGRGRGRGGVKIWATCWLHSFLSKAIYNLSTFSVQVVEPTSCMVQINIYNIIASTSPASHM
jgi:hypothetical protein